MLNDPTNLACGATLHKMSKSWHHLPPSARGKTNAVAAGLFPGCLETLPIAKQCSLPQREAVAACADGDAPHFGCVLTLVSSPFL